MLYRGRSLFVKLEEKNELIPYVMLSLVARGLDCDPVDILGE